MRDFLRPSKDLTPVGELWPPIPAGELWGIHMPQLKSSSALAKDPECQMKVQDPMCCD